MLYNIARALSWFYLRVICGMKTEGRENLPKDGAALICANHIHLLDPAALGINLNRYVSYLAKKEIFEKRFSRWLFTGLHAIPVERDGTDTAAVMKALRILKKGGLLGIFPEGTRERGRGMLEFKPGAAFISIVSKAPVIPAYIEGRYMPFGKLRVVFGSPIMPPDIKKPDAEDLKEFSDRLAQTIKGLKEKQ